MERTGHRKGKHVELDPNAEMVEPAVLAEARSSRDDGLLIRRHEKW